MNPFLLALVVSVAGNGLLGWLYLGERDNATAARSDLQAVTRERDGARAAASACSDATADLRELADKREAEAKELRKKAADTASGHNKRADVILSIPAAIPGNDCASAQVRVSDWLKGRAQP